ncbi:MAG: arylesterase [Rhodobacterales bacterium]|jgi:acyl-CoA thioesterase I
MIKLLLKRLVQYGAWARIGNLLAVVLVLNLTVNAASAETVTIAAFGDSLTQGYGLPDGDGLVPQLQVWLETAGQDVKLVNMGVSGDTTAGGLARIDWTLTDEIKALIVELGGNDILRGLPPTESRRNLEGILQAAAVRGLPVLLVGMQAPGNYGADYKQDFDAIYPDLAALYNTLLFPVYLAPILDGRSFADALKAFMQADGIHPNKAGVGLIVPVIGPYVVDLVGKIE